MSERSSIRYNLLMDDNADESPELTNERYSFLPGALYQMSPRAMAGPHFIIRMGEIYYDTDKCPDLYYLRLCGKTVLLSEEENGNFFLRLLSVRNSIDLNGFIGRHADWEIAA